MKRVVMRSVMLQKSGLAESLLQGEATPSSCCESTICEFEWLELTFFIMNRLCQM